MGRVRTTWLAWAMAVALGRAGRRRPCPWPRRNGEGPAELVSNHHAIGIVTAIGMAVLGAMIASRQPARTLSGG